MSSIVYQTDRRSGTTYAYRSKPVRDPVTGKPSQKRTYLGRVDPETGEIVPKAAKGKRNRSKVGDQSQAQLPLTVAESTSLRDESELLRAEVTRLQARVDELEGLISRMAAECGKVLGAKGGEESGDAGGC
jgi:hypothetical protein